MHSAQLLVVFLAAIVKWQVLSVIVREAGGELEDGEGEAEPGEDHPDQNEQTDII